MFNSNFESLLETAFGFISNANDELNKKEIANHWMV